MKNKDLIDDVVEQMDKTLESLDLILALGTVKNILTYQNRYDAIKSIRDEIDQEILKEY